MDWYVCGVLVPCMPVPCRAMCDYACARVTLVLRWVYMRMRLRENECVRLLFVDVPFPWWVALRHSSIPGYPAKDRSFHRGRQRSRRRGARASSGSVPTFQVSPCAVPPTRASSSPLVVRVCQVVAVVSAARWYSSTMRYSVIDGVIVRLAAVSFTTNFCFARY